MISNKSNYHKMAEYFGYGSSKLLLDLLKTLYSEEEIELATLLPARIFEISERLKENPNKIEDRMIDLFSRGLVIIEDKIDDKEVYSIPEDIGMTMDMVLFDMKYQSLGSEFYDKWKEFYNREYLIKKAKEKESLGLRVIPAGESFNIDGTSKVMVIEDIKKILREARIISVQNCACRTRERNCESPLEVDIGLNNFAEYCIERGIGREITFKEAIEKITWAESKGLIHMTANSDHPDVICNCCTCCCSLMKAILETGNKNALEKSRFRSKVDSDLCNNCLRCVKICKFKSLLEKDSRLIHKTENCYGCGLCVSECPEKAITLVEIESKDFIPSGPGFLNSYIPGKLK